MGDIAVTIKQIAEMAGVSRGTVDRALNQRGGVKKEVEEKILRIAKDLHYQPNAVAKALANTKKHYVIGVLLNSAGNDFFDEVKQGIFKAQKEIESFGVKLAVRVMKGFRVETQLEHIHDLFEQGIHALALTPIDDRRIIDRLNQLIGQKIPVVTFNADVEGVQKLAFIGCNYRKSGEIAGALMGMFHPQGAKVGIVTGSVKMLGHNQRIHGFNQVVKAQYPNIKVLDIVEDNDDNLQAFQEVQAMLRRFPEINALYFTAAGVRGALEAVQVMGLARKLNIITFDETPFIVEKLKEGTISATIGQQPFTQGYRAIRVLFEYLVQGRLPESAQIYTENEIKIKYSF